MPIPTRALLAAAAAAALPGLAAAQIAGTTVTFRDGVGGYDATEDRTLSENPSGNLSGDFNDYYFLDGNPTSGSPDTQGLIRFDNIIGAGPGQIPSGAYILDASLTLTTAPGEFNGNSQTGGPYGVARLLQPFSLTSQYTDFGPQGPQVDAGSIDRPVGNYGDTDGNDIEQGEVVSAFAAPIVQAWADGADNHGVTVQSGPEGTTNGWAIATSSNQVDVNQRPQLSVTYTTETVTRASYQEGVNGYAGTDSTVISRLPDGTTEIIDGDTNGFEFLDGPNDLSDAGSADEQLNIKFDNLFAAEGGSVPDNAEIVRAYLVLTTTEGQSGAATTGEPYDAHQLLVPFDDETGFEDFGGDGPTEADGEIGPILDQVIGGVQAGEAWFNVTDAVANFLAGDENFGFNVQASDIAEDLTDDGWQIYLPGIEDAELRPELVIDYAVLDRLVGDANGDGTVSIADFAILRSNFGSDGSSFEMGDFNEDGSVTIADFALLRANFGRSVSAAQLAEADAWAATVPEPAALGLLAAAGLGLLRRRA